MTPTSQNLPHPDRSSPAPGAPSEQSGDAGEFGPRGYLPQKAAARARKIVLREQMGVHWTIAAVVAGLLILAITIPLVVSGTREPQPPFVDVGSLAAIDPAGSQVVAFGGTEVLVVRGGGVLAAFASPPRGVQYCARSRLIEGPDGAVWSLQGRAIGGDSESLVPLRAVAYDDRLYIDPTTGARPAAGTGGVTPACITD